MSYFFYNAIINASSLPIKDIFCVSLERGLERGDYVSSYVVQIFWNISYMNLTQIILLMKQWFQVMFLLQSNVLL